MGHRARLAVVTGVAVLVAASCGSPRQDVAASAAEAFSATRSVQLVLETAADGRVTDNFVDVTVDEALGSLSAARASLDLVPVTNRDEADLQTRVGAAIDAAIEAVTVARQGIEGVGGAPAPSTALADVRDAAHALDEVRADAGSPR